MSRPEKLNVFIGIPSYGGNGGIASEHPDVRDWLIYTITEMKADPRIGKVVWKTFNDTPITMVRNDIVKQAKQQGCHVLVMVDSDQAPDLYLGKDPDAKPFWKTSFEFLWNHYEKGPILIGAPYCGPPPHPTNGGGENVYVFTWVGMEAATHGGRAFTTPVMNQISRPHANMMSGIQECAALPTGVIAYDMRCFDHISHPYFAYEWVDETQSHKASTEDVYNTRNISLAVMLKLGYNPCFCNWDAWAGHWKPKCVGRPFALTVEAVAENLREAVMDGVSSQERLVSVDYDKNENGPAEPHPGWAPRHGEAHGVEHPNEDWEMQARLLTAIAEKADGKLQIAEVGTWVGNNAVRMSDLLDSLGVEHVIYCVDTFRGSPSDQTSLISKDLDVHAEFLKNTAHKGDKIVAVHADSVAGSALVPSELDYVFIDADHEFDAVLSDIAVWWNKVRIGGLLAGHDYSEAFPGVMGAWEESFVVRKEMPLTSYANVCWVQKAEVPEPVGV